MRIIFAGTPAFAVPSLRQLLRAGHQVCAVYTQPDRPAGRGRKLQASPVKQLAVEAGLPVLQPAHLKDPADIAQLAAFGADLMVVVAYGLILPAAVLAIPALGCVNVHASLLPRWRGAAPIQRAIMAGDEETGVTVIQLVPRLDAGPMLHQAPCRLAPADTAATVHDRLAELGAAALAGVLPGLAQGRPQGLPQDESQATYAHKLDKQEAGLDWTQPALRLERQVRGLNPWPVAHTLCQGQTLRVWLAQAVPGPAPARPGLAAVRDGQLEVATGDGWLRLHELQLPGGKRMAAAALLRAHPLDGVVLG